MAASVLLSAFTTSVPDGGVGNKNLFSHNLLIHCDLYSRHRKKIKKSCEKVWRIKNKRYLCTRNQEIHDSS